MMPSSKKQVLNPDEHTEIKYPDGDKIIVGDFEGRLLEFSMVEKKIVHDFGKIMNVNITSMAKTLTNKS